MCGGKWREILKRFVTLAVFFSSLILIQIRLYPKRNSKKKNVLIQTSFCRSVNLGALQLVFAVQVHLQNHIFLINRDQEKIYVF